MLSEPIGTTVIESAEKAPAEVRRVKSAVRGGVWSIAGYVTTQVVRTVVTLVLARHFLGPEAFGVVGLLGVFLAGLAMFSELGILANVVQHPRGEDPGFLNTAFTIQGVRGVAIWVVATLAAYPLATFYQQPILFPMLVVAGLSEMLRGLTSTAAWTHTRKVELRGITLLTITSEVFAAGAAIAWAFIAPSAWVLVVRIVVSAAIFAMGSHLIASPKVKPGWDAVAAKDILHFGGWVSVATGAYFLSGQGERLILGKFVTAAELGCFSLAIMISSVPAGGVSQLVNQIFLPILSATIRKSRTEGVHDFLRTRRVFFGLAVLTAIGFLALGQPVVALVLRRDYAMTGWMLQILGVRVALDVFAAPASTLLLAYGKSKYSATASTVRLILMVAGSWICLKQFGIYYAVISLVVAQAFSYFAMIVGLARVLPEVVWAECRCYGTFLMLLALAAFVPWPGV